MGIGKYLWGCGGNGDSFMGMGWGCGKFYGDGVIFFLYFRCRQKDSIAMHWQVRGWHEDLHPSFWTIRDPLLCHMGGDVPVLVCACGLWNKNKLLATLHLEANYVEFT